MMTPADSTPGHEAPKERVAGLTAALLRISVSLDLETVLREVLEVMTCRFADGCGRSVCVVPAVGA